MGRDLLYRQHDTTTDPTTCRNSGLLDSSEIKLKDDHSKQGARLSEKKTYIKLDLVRSLSRACRACGVGKCDSKDCVEFKKTLAKLNPRCGNWSDLDEWAVQLAACICSQKERAYKKDPCKLPAEFTSLISLVNRYSDEYSSENVAENFDWANGVELSDVLSVLGWLNGITTGRYEVLHVPNELQQDTDTRQIMEAVERAKAYKLCPRRVWAIAGSLPGRELNLPALIPSGTDSVVVGHGEHDRCTFDFCEYSRKNFTAQKQRHECSDGKCEQRLTFPQTELEEPALAGNPTAWTLHGGSIIKPDQPFMAISHVWADGTGTGPWQAGEVNKCLYDFFCRIAARFQCEGIWWDTICIPRDDKKARSEAMNNLQSNYVGARITLVHDLYLREWEWVDAESACFAIVMSTWFSRGWTSLELAKSGKVKVLFKSRIIKDLDEDILAKPGEPSSPWRQVATAAIFNLRRQRITGVNDILTALGPRYTSKPKDMAIISGLLAGVEIPIDPSQHEIYQRILRKINQVSQGHLFHNSATMTEGFSWCPTSLLDIPLALTSSTLNILENGDIVGRWRAFRLEAFPSEQYIWRDTHPLIRVKMQLALKNKDKHLFLVEAEVASITRALLVKIVREKEELPRWIHCQFVGPVHFIWPQTGGTEEAVMIKARIGDVKGMSELENEIAYDYVFRMAVYLKNQDTHECKGGGSKESGENDRPDPNAKEVLCILKEKADDFNSRGKYAKTILHMAAERGYASAVRLLLHTINKDDVNARDSMGWTALLLAAGNGNGAVVELLLKGEADPNLADNYEQRAPLHRAAWGGFKAIVEQLLNNEANPANPRASDKLGWSALHLGAERGEEDVVQVLLEKVIDVNVLCTNNGKTVLHSAAWGGSTVVVRLLLEKGVKPNTKDNFGQTALHMAAEKGYASVVRLLLHKNSKDDVNVRDSMGHTALLLAAGNGNVAVVKLLLKGEADPNLADNYKQATPLHRAAWGGFKAIVEQLLNNEANPANPRASDKLGWSALHLGAERGVEDVVQVLLEKVIDVNVLRTNNGKTVLHSAALGGSTAVVRLLLEKGVDPNAQDNFGQTALHMAAERGYASMVELLLKGEADPNLADNYEQTTPLHRAAWGGFKEIVEQLLNNEANPANPRASDKLGRSALHLGAERGEKDVVQVLLEKVIDVNVLCTNDGQTVLHRAAWGGSTAVVRLLLEKGVDPNTEDNFGWTALHMAAEQGHMWVVHLLFSDANQTASRGIQIERGNKEGWTVMHCAAHNGHEGVVRMLIHMGANIDTRNLYQCTPLHLAAENGHKAIVELLVEMQANIYVQDCYGHTALHRASGMGQEAIAQLLVKKMDNVNIHDNIGSTALHLAVDAKHERIVQLLVESGADVNVTAKGTEMPLHLAAQNGHEGIAQLLVEKRADVNGKIMYGGMAALHLAAERGHKAVVSLLLKNGVDLESRSGDGQTALALAAEVGNEAMVQLLLEKDADVHFEDWEGNRPLSLAAAWDGNTAQSFVEPESSKSFRGSEVVGWQLVEKGAKSKWGLVRLLLEKGVNLVSINKDGWTTLGLAMARGDRGMVELLLEKHPNVCFQDWEDNTQFSRRPWNRWISFGGHEMVGRRLMEKGADLEAKNKRGWTAMHHASHNGHEGFVRMLIENTANVNALDDGFGNPLHLAAENGQNAVVQLLVEKGARIDKLDGRMWTALFYAVNIGHEKIVQFLLENGAHLLLDSACRYQQETALHLAAQNGHCPGCRCQQQTALHLAARNGHEGIARLLIEKCDTVDLRPALSVQAISVQGGDRTGMGTPLSWAVQYEHEAIVRVLLAKGYNLNERDDIWLRTPLLWAVQKGNEAIVKLLLLTAIPNTYACIYYVERELPDRDGRTPLLWAVQKGNEAIVKLLLLTDLRITRLDTDIRIQTYPDYPDYDKRTPLWWAVQEGNEAIVKLLLESEAKPDIEDKDGRTPMSCASEKGDQAIVDLLLGKGGEGGSDVAFEGLKYI